MTDFEELKGKLRGPTVLVMTPFRDDYELNLGALKENIQFMMDSGIGNGKGTIICPCGVGEYVTLSPEENRMVVEAAAEVGGSKLPVIAGVASWDYRVAIKLALSAAEAGAKCVMIPSPNYYPISQEGIYRWYELIAEGIKNIGIVAYDQPWRAEGTFITVPLMGKLAQIENIVSIKYSSRSIVDHVKALGLYSKRFSFIDNTPTYRAIAPLAHGKAAGYVTNGGSFWPELDAKYWSLLEQGQYEEAAKWYARIDPYTEFKSGKGTYFHASVIKAALEYVGLYGGPVRPPFIELTEEQKKILFGVLEGIGIPKKSC